jgi:hypothetical protein
VATKIVAVFLKAQAPAVALPGQTPGSHFSTYLSVKIPKDGFVGAASAAVAADSAVACSRGLPYSENDYDGGAIGL